MFKPNPYRRGTDVILMYLAGRDDFITQVASCAQTFLRRVSAKGKFKHLISVKSGIYKNIYVFTLTISSVDIIISSKISILDIIGSMKAFQMRGDEDEEKEASISVF